MNLSRLLHWWRCRWLRHRISQTVADIDRIDAERTACARTIELLSRQLVHLRSELWFTEHPTSVFRQRASLRSADRAPQKEAA